VVDQAVASPEYGAVEVAAAVEAAADKVEVSEYEFEQFDQYPQCLDKNITKLNFIFFWG